MNEGRSDFSDYQGPDELTAAQLPAPLLAPEEPQRFFQPQQQSPFNRQIRPEDLIRKPQSSLPTNPVTRISHIWKNDPAYRVLFIAISVMFISCIICAAVLANALSQPNPQKTLGNTTSLQQATSNPRPMVTPTATPIPTPTEIPTPTPMPIVIPTPTPVPTQPPLTIQITNIPLQAQNNTTVSVKVTASQPGVTVFLSITYPLGGGQSSTTQPQQTDSQGNATISWKVQASTQQGGTIAQVTATAQDQQGHPATSFPATVAITTRGG